MATREVAKVGGSDSTLEVDLHFRGVAKQFDEKRYSLIPLAALVIASEARQYGISRKINEEIY